MNARISLRKCILGSNRAGDPKPSDGAFTGVNVKRYRSPRGLRYFIVNRQNPTICAIVDIAAHHGARHNII